MEKIMISNDNDRKECMELMKKIDAAIYSAHNTVCNCDMSLMESDFNKLLKDKQKCVPCRDKVIRTLSTKNTIPCEEISETDIFEHLSDDLYKQQQSIISVPCWLRGMGGYSN